MTTLAERANQKDQDIARKALPSVCELAKVYASRKEPVIVEIQDDEQVHLVLPVKVFELLDHILSLMADGKAFSLVPEDSELTTQQAADMLNVSRPFLVKLLEAGELPFKKVGSHRRILMEDLLSYISISEANRGKALKELARQAQDLKMGY
jgi:excisionase family DNA binding protein